jgi:hypothetical protein
MEQFAKLAFLLIGNICRWISYGGKKSMDDVVKEDNWMLGLIVSIIIFFFFYSFNYH